MAHEYFETAPHFRPYRWAAPEFQVGLQSISARDWLILDADYSEFMCAKRAHLTRFPATRYKALPGSLPAQRELRGMVADHLLEDHGQRFSLSNGVLTSTVDRESWDFNDESVEPLRQLSDFVQEDFMLLEEIDGGQVISAASNAYSSSGRLVSSVGHDMRWTHEPVPGLTAAHGARIDRILATVHEDRPCARFNWQLTPLSSIFFPDDPHAANRAALTLVSERLAGDPSLAPSLLHMRVERQTLRRLPVTRAVAFSIHTYSDPLSSLVPDPASTQALLELLEGYPLSRLQYSEMDTIHAAVIAWLSTLPAGRA
jgi:dimethylamine monooxygenase subunit A